MSIQVSRLSMSYGPRSLWEGLSWEFPQESITGITGKSGAGKSTLLYCLGAMLKPTSGSIMIDDVDITRASARMKRKLHRETYGFLFQNYGLSSDVNVKRNLELAFPRLSHASKSRKKKMEEVLDVVGLPPQFLRAPIVHLSGGEQQRVALARILLRKPQIVLADEPTGALDQENTDVVIEHLRNFAENGATVIIATHDDYVKRHCDEIIDMSSLT